jgi:hypothetical protein
MKIIGKVKCLPTHCCGFFSGGWLKGGINSIAQLFLDNGWVRGSYRCPSCHQLNELNDLIQFDINTVKEIPEAA